MKKKQTVKPYSCESDVWKSTLTNLTLELSLSHFLQADRQSSSLLHMLCTAPSTSFIQTPISPCSPSPDCPPPHHLEVPHSWCSTIFWLLTLNDSPTEAAPHGPSCSRRQHSPLQLHSHGLDSHGTWHQDRQGYGRFGIFHTSYYSIFTLSSSFSYFLLSAVMSSISMLSPETFGSSRCFFYCSLSTLCFLWQ